MSIWNLYLGQLRRPGGLWGKGGAGWYRAGIHEYRVTCSLIQCNPYLRISNESNKSNQLEIQQYKKTVHNIGVEPGILDE